MLCNAGTIGAKIGMTEVRICDLEELEKCEIIR